MSRHLLLRLAYCGTNYHGFQVQKNGITVSEVLQNAIERVFGERHDIKGCSRTDAGVHANDFCVGFFTDRSLPCENVVKALNVNLPKDIVVKACSEVPHDFHPRYNALGKRYVYKLLCSPVRNPFCEGLCLYTNQKPDVERMYRAAALFMGTHDFSAFTNTGGSVTDKVRTITACTVQQENELILFSVTGNGFLYNMVRIMMGTLLEIGLERRSEDSISLALTSGQRSHAGATAPACGLYLDRVFYDEEIERLF